MTDKPTWPFDCTPEQFRQCYETAIQQYMATPQYKRMMEGKQGD